MDKDINVSQNIPHSFFMLVFKMSLKNENEPIAKYKHYLFWGDIFIIVLIV